jgi:hypothetical protein
MVKRLLPLVIIVLSLFALAGIAFAGGGQSSVAVARQATARFHDLKVAEAAGYTIHVQDLSGATCIDNGAVGAMGDHFANGALLLDGGVIDAAAPEALVYEQRNNGTYKLVALEYIVFQTDWETAGHTSPPALFGRTFDFTDSPNRYGLPPFYALHAWIWKPNPSGLFFAWNPTVECEG